MKKIRYIGEAIILYVFYYSFKLMPVDWASAIGGWLGRTIGPRLAASRKALRNVQNALPDLSDDEHQNAIVGMWENLGRVFAEYPHLDYLVKNRTTYKNIEHVERVIDAGEAGILFGAHLANWEIGACFIPALYDQRMSMTYRAPNNPWADKLIIQSRGLNDRVTAHPKSRQAGRGLIQAIKDKEFIGVLLDQKFNEGVSVPFFGMEAMTNPAFVQLSQKYDCPLIPAHSKRLNGAHFEIELSAPIKVKNDDGSNRDVEEVLVDLHDMFEAWIKAAPEKWMWLHRRWPN